MLSFSQRMGLKPIRTQIQIDSMDDDLRNSLWNNLTILDSPKFHCIVSSIETYAAI